MATTEISGKQFILRRCHRPGIEAVEADTRLAFGRHTHEQFGLGLIGRGAQKSASGRGFVEACAGDVITVNPGEVHDGAPIGDGGRSWRMLYVDPSVVAELSVDFTEGGSRPALEFSQPCVRDKRVARHFAFSFEALTSDDTDTGHLAADASLLLLLQCLLQPKPGGVATPPAAIALARSLIDDDPAAPLTLTALAQTAGLSRYQFLRGFARMTGLSPHAYVVQRRIHLARRLIARGAGLAEAAAQSGFADQSHMTRVFVRTFGTAPGRYVQALGRASGPAISFKTPETDYGEDRR